MTPDDRRIAVFIKGTCSGLNGKIPVGSHNDPISIVGDKLLWKKAKKNNEEEYLNFDWFLSVTLLILKNIMFLHRWEDFS